MTIDYLDLKRSMAKSLERSFKSYIYKVLRRVFKLLGYGVQGTCYVLGSLHRLFALLILLCWVCIFLWSFYSILWIGSPIAMTCQNVDFVRIDCTLKYRALLRESEQNVKDVRGSKVEINVSTSDSGTTIDYKVSLQAQSGDHFIKSYSSPNDPEIKSLQYRLNQFIEHPEEHMTVLLK
jgi:hypothetical protein